MKRLLVLSSIILFLSACQNSSGQRVDNESLWRLVDKEAGVVCWYSNSYNLSCLPIEETKLVISE